MRFLIDCFLVLPSNFSDGGEGVRPPKAKSQLLQNSQSHSDPTNKPIQTQGASDLLGPAAGSI